MDGKNGVSLIVFPAEHVSKLKVRNFLPDLLDLGLNLHCKRFIAGFFRKISERSYIIHHSLKASPRINPFLAVAYLLHHLLRCNVVTPKIRRAGPPLESCNFLFLGLQVKENLEGQSPVVSTQQSLASVPQT
jgi:hypothetical protein